MYTFVGLADALGPNDYTFVFPNAPFPASATRHPEQARWSWLAPGEGPGINSRSAIWEYLTSFLEQVSTSIAPGRELFIGGFSQGGACALQYGIKHAKRFAGIIGLSTWFIGDPAPAKPPSPVAIFLAHGFEDQTVPVAAGRACKTKLQAAGYAVAYTEYRMQHELCLTEIRDLRSWLKSRWPSQSPSAHAR